MVAAKTKMGRCCSVGCEKSFSRFKVEIIFKNSSSYVNNVCICVA